MMLLGAFVVVLGSAGLFHLAGLTYFNGGLALGVVALHAMCLVLCDQCRRIRELLLEIVVELRRERNAR